MKRGLMRPTDILFPLAGIAAALLNFPEILTETILYYYTLQIFSLCAVDSFRNAAAREPGVRRVDKRFGGALAQLAIGAGIFAVMMYIGTRADGGAEYALPMFGAGLLLIIEQLFEERMHAIGRSLDVNMMSLLSALLFFAGVALDHIWNLDAPFFGIFTLCGAGLGALIAIISSLIIEPLHSFSLVPRNIVFCLKAGVQSLLFPAALFCMLILECRRGEHFMRAVEYYAVLPLFMGLIPWRLSRTVCRRSADESRPLNLLLLAFAALGVIACVVLDTALYGFKYMELACICADALVLALVCGAVAFCAPGVRFYAGVILIVAAGSMNRFYVPYGEVIAIGMCMVAVALNVKKAFLRKV